MKYLKKPIEDTTQPVQAKSNQGGAQLDDRRASAVLQQKQVAALSNKQTNETAQKKANTTGLPDQLKSGIENLSGHAMDDVKVHYNSSQPAQLNAHAYAQGNQIHIASGQEKHLPHEAWHVVQQKQGRVKPTMQMKGKVNVNDDAGLEKEADVMGVKALQFKGRTENKSSYRSADIQPITFQLFKDKVTGKPIPEIPAIGEMTDKEVEKVRDLMDKGKIEAESQDELDLFLGRAYGTHYSGFPNLEEFKAAEKVPFKSSEDRVSQNAGSIFTAEISGKMYFIKKMKDARGAATETIVPFLAMRLGLTAHMSPTVWYQVGDDNFAVTPIMKGAVTNSSEEIAKSDIPNERLLELFLFDYLVGSYDRIPQNVFIDASGQAKLIDNEGSLGISGHGTAVKSTKGFSRIGYKSAFLAAFMNRIGATLNIFHPRGATMLPKAFDTVLIPEALLLKIVNIGREIITLLHIMGLPDQNIVVAIKHLNTLAEKGKVTVSDILK